MSTNPTQSLSTLSLKKARGVYLYDYQQNKYIDFKLCDGSLILGHRHPKITKALKAQVSKGYVMDYPNALVRQLSKRILRFYTDYAYLEFYSSAEEVFHALRLSSQHELLFLGERYRDLKIHNPLVLPHQDPQVIQDYILAKNGRVLCLEPFVSTHGLRKHTKEFLEALDKSVQKYSLTVVVDERRSNFRVSDSLQGIRPDKVLLGPTIGGAFPLHAILHRTPPTPQAYQERCFPLYYAAGLEALKYIERTPLSKHWTQLCDMLSEGSTADIAIHTLGSLFSIQIQGASQDQQQKQHRKLSDYLLSQGILLDPTCAYLSTAHTPREIERLLTVLKNYSKKA